MFACLPAARTRITPHLSMEATIALPMIVAAGATAILFSAPKPVSDEKRMRKNLLRNPLRKRKFITKEGLRQLSRYAYKSGDYSVMDNVLNPFWTHVVNYLPMWMAPNLVTLLGSLCVVLSYFVVLFHTPQLEGPMPAWTNIFVALALFAYQTLDAIDGKQARRTKQSSPLGQLFDHGALLRDSCRGVESLVFLSAVLVSPPPPPAHIHPLC